MNDPHSEDTAVTVVRPPGDDPASRRRFIRLVGLAGGAVALSGLLAACSEEEQPPPSEAGELAPADRDVDIVNYALFLEYLEEQFYDQVLESGEIDDSGLRGLIEQVYGNEVEHAKALEELATQLGANPVDRPRTNFGNVISGGQTRILDTAAEIENLGASAYLGQAPLIQNNFVLEAALAVHTVEARHAAALNEVAGFGFQTGADLRGSVPQGPFANPRSRRQVLDIATEFVRV